MDKTEEELRKIEQERWDETLTAKEALSKARDNHDEKFQRALSASKVLKQFREETK
jgi:hypothetical protein